MLKIYLDYNAGSGITFPLDYGPEQEGTTIVDQEGLCPRPGPAGDVSPPAGMEGKTPVVH